MSSSEKEGGGSEKTRKFIDTYWSKALIVAGAAGAIGAAVWLTARYLREKKKREAREDNALELVENEVGAGNAPSTVLLETGTYLGEVSGGEAKSALIELAREMDDTQAKEALELLRKVIDIHEGN